MAGWFGQQGVPGYTANQTIQGAASGSTAGSGSATGTGTGTLGNPVMANQTIQGDTSAGSGSGSVWNNGVFNQQAALAQMEQYGAAQGRSASDLASTEQSDAAYWLPKMQAGGQGQEAYWDSRMQAPPGQGSNGGGGGVGGYGGGGANLPGAPGFNQFNAPAPFQGSTWNQQFSPNSQTPNYNAFQGAAPFQAPTAEQAAQNPGYQFGLQQGVNALENSASAKGALGSPNTLTGIEQYGNQAATQNYQQVLQNEQGIYQQNLNNAFQQNQANNQGNLQFQAQQFGQGAQTYGLQQGAQAQQYGQQLGTYQQNFNNALSANQWNNQGALSNYQAQVQAALGQGQLQLGQGYMGLYGQNQGFNQGLQLNQNAWNQNMGLAQLGNPGAPNYAQYGVNQGNVYQGVGNTTAAGQLQQGNIYSGAVNGLGQMAGYYGMNQASQPWTDSSGTVYPYV